MEKVEGLPAIDVTISVVSHSQIGLIKNLLEDIDKHCRDSHFELILTLNVDEVLPFSLNDYFFPIKIIRNPNPLGFGANHNQAFKHAYGQYFCVINPDIRLSSNPFSGLLSCFSDSIFWCCCASRAWGRWSYGRQCTPLSKSSENFMQSFWQVPGCGLRIRGRNDFSGLGGWYVHGISVDCF